VPEPPRPAVERLATRLVYENPWLSLREDRVRRLDGAEGIYSVVDKPDFALVIPIDGDRVHLVEQYRYPLGRRCVEFPQGHAPGSSPLEVAKTELAEETGLTATRWRHLGRLAAAYGFCSQSYDVFLAGGLALGAHAREASEQDMRHLTVSRAELEAMIADGRIEDAHSVAAYGLLLLAEGRGAGPSAP
jgi:8-oxo-dGTP pyrophosphatase MutT (NUDIX family)